MGDEKRYTEREVLLREQNAFLDGARHASFAWNDARRKSFEEEAERRYRLLVRTRGVRVKLSDGATVWREGELLRMGATHKDYTTLLTGRGALPTKPTAEDFRQIARLLDDEQEPVPEGEA